MRRYYRESSRSSSTSATAKALGLAIPGSFLARAHERIVILTQFRPAEIVERNVSEELAGGTIQELNSKGNFTHVISEIKS
jgi:hypothetical protein